jgi:hypothetical protein
VSGWGVEFSSGGGTCKWQSSKAKTMMRRTKTVAAEGTAEPNNKQLDDHEKTKTMEK